VIAETDFADLQRYDIGNNERIPRFSDLLAILKPGKKLYAEIKIPDLRIIPGMMAAIDASNVRREQLVVISFKRSAIKEFKTLYPDIPALLLVGLKKEDDGSYSPAIDETFEALANFRHGDRESLLETAFAAVKECSADGIDVRGYPDEIDETWVNKFHDAGMFFAVWTIDDVPTAQYLINIGVDSITSNCAAKVRDEIL
jgi:glycerophosphoryl diester phosphodiesterase